MVLKNFGYKVEGEERPTFQKIKEDNNVRYLESKDWKTEDKQGSIDKYLISPGFYVELTSNSIIPIMSIGEEKKEREFKLNLERILGKKIIPK